MVSHISCNDLWLTIPIFLGPLESIWSNISIKYSEVVSRNYVIYTTHKPFIRSVVLRNLMVGRPYLYFFYVCSFVNKPCVSLLPNNGNISLAQLNKLADYSSLSFNVLDGPVLFLIWASLFSFLWGKVNEKLQSGYLLFILWTISPADSQKSRELT